LMRSGSQRTRGEVEFGDVGAPIHC
jgi:hypothetical protein